MTVMVMTWTWALLATAAPPPAAMPAAVRLAPVRCGDLADATVRAPLRVELGRRLLDEDAPDGPDSLLVSISCQGSDATLVVVHPGRGPAKIQRLVRLGDVAPQARPRELALAAVELVHVADVSSAARPLAHAPAVTVAPPATVDRTPVPSLRPPRSWTLTINGSLAFGGGYFASGYLPTEGVSVGVGVEHGPERPASPSWQWALRTEFTFLGGRYQSGTTGGLIALVQRRGHSVVPELGFGGRAGYITGVPTGETTTSVVAGGPVASVGVSMRFLPAISFLDVSLETGYDLHGPGAWILPRLGYGFRF